MNPYWFVSGDRSFRWSRLQATDATLSRLTEVSNPVHSCPATPGAFPSRIARYHPEQVLDFVDFDLQPVSPITAVLRVAGRDTLVGRR